MQKAKYYPVTRLSLMGPSRERLGIAVENQLKLLPTTVAKRLRSNTDIVTIHTAISKMIHQRGRAEGFTLTWTEETPICLLEIWVEAFIVGWLQGQCDIAQDDLLISIEIKFGSVPPAIEERIRKSKDFLQLWSARRQLLQGTSLDDLLV